MASISNRRVQLRSAVAGFGASTSGNIAMITALMLLPILGIGGLAVDYSMSSLQYNKLKANSDAAALFGAKRGAQMVNEGNQHVLQYLQVDVAEYFHRNANVPGLQSSVQIRQNSESLSVSINWEAEPRSILGKLFQKESYKIAGVGEATAGLAPYIKLYAVVDVSQSMGIGATVADQMAMFNREGCMFACHLPHTPSKQGLASSYVAARQAGNNTRVDIAREALLKVVESARAASSAANGRIRLGVYAFANTVETLVDIDSADAMDFDRIKQVVTDRLILGRDGGGTDLRDLHEFFRSKVSSGGDGTSPWAPKVSVILVSDGVANSSYFPDRGSRLGLDVDVDNHNKPTSVVGAIQEPRSQVPAYNPKTSVVQAHGMSQEDVGQMGIFDSRICSKMKDQNVKVKVVETPYVLPPNQYRLKENGEFDVRFFWLNASGAIWKIKREMESCATPGYYVSADDGPALNEAIVSLAADALSDALRLVK